MAAESFRFYPPAACCAPAVTSGECECQPEATPAAPATTTVQASYALAA